MKRTIIKIICVMVVLITVVFSFSVSAAEYQTDYTINNGKQIPIPKAYNYSYRIDAAKSNELNFKNYFDQPEDIKLGGDGFLYIADTKNNRVVRMSKDGELASVYTEANGLKYKQPRGVYIHNDGTLFIADTGNERIVRINLDGSVVKIFERPQASELSDMTVYEPSKIAFSQYGELYVLMGENIMMLDEDNNFRGYIGQTKIGYNFIEALLRKIASDVQKKSIQKRTASAYDNIYLSKDNLIYAVNRDTTEGQIKIINSVGNNIYRKVSSHADSGITLSGFISRFMTGNIIRKSFSYGERINGEDPMFTGICVDENGIIFAVEKLSGNIYQYDQTGNLLAVFGGLGENNGQLTLPSSMCVDEQGNLYVLDTSKGSVIVYSPTNFIKLVHSAVTSYYIGDYDAAQSYYQKILEIDATYPLAHEGLADAAYKAEKLEEALVGYTVAGDRAKYSTAFTQYRYKFIKSNFFLVAIISIIVIVVVVFGLSSVAKRSKKVIYDVEYHFAPINIKNGFLVAASILFRPGRTIDSIKIARGKVNTTPAWIIMLMVFVTRIIFIYTVHYPLQDIELADVNLVLEFFKLIVPVMTWVMASYLISSQLDGESTLTECFVSTAYAMVPYIVMNLSATILSHIMSQNETGFFAVMVNGVTVWILILFISAIQRLNDYSGMRTIAVVIITIIAVVLIWFVALFGYSLIVRLFLFFGEVIQELQISVG